MSYDLTKNTNLGQLKKVAERVQTEITAVDNKITTLSNEVVTSVVVSQKSTANEGYAASYQILVNDTPLATEINIPKDFLVKSALLKVSTVENFETIGTSAAGKKYIDFVINSKDGTATASHIYLPVEDLVDVYTPGNGLTESNNEFSVVINSNSANGLSVDSNGIALALVTDNTYTEGVSNNDGNAGAMSVADKHKLDGVAVNATNVSVATEGNGIISVNGVDKTVVAIATNEEVDEMLTEVFGATASEETTEP